MKEHKTLINEEAPFDISELFFSTTDRKGIITSCNEVFLRVASYEPRELLGQPHNTIRHPDMPKCVFNLLWEYLLAGRAIGAYVKNLSNTGKYYWVFAVACPYEGGFISIRVKPTSSVLPAVKSLYKELKVLEDSYGKDWRAGMQASTEELLKRLRELGFDTYDEFMNISLRQELVSSNVVQVPTAHVADDRRRREEKGVMQIFHELDRLLDLQKRLKEKEGYFLALGEHMTTIAINASIRAAKLGQEGSSLGVISEEISNVSKEIEKESSDLKSRSAQLASALGEMSFLIAQSILQQKMIEFFQFEQKQREMTPGEERIRYGREISEASKVLEVCARQSLKQCIACIMDLQASFRGFDAISSSLEKVLLTIQFSYVTGKTVTARIAGAEQFSALLSDLLTLSESGRSELGKLKSAVKEVRSNVVDWHLEAGR